MSVLQDVGKIVGATTRVIRVAARGIGVTVVGGTQASRWFRRTVHSVRERGGAGNVGLMRLLDLHAASCAGDTLVTIGLAGTIFFGAPAGEARGRVAVYLLVTMVPFALLAPVVGPLLDRLRHGRRYALAATMLGRAVLALLIADNLVGLGLYPAAFGVLALSRAYGVARSAAVPRLCPPGVDLSQAGARASAYGTVAGVLVAPIGALAFTLGPQWPLRVSAVIFVLGGIVALRLPPKADSDRPEVTPVLFRLRWWRRLAWSNLRSARLPWSQRASNGEKILSGGLVLGALAGSAAMRAGYGFMLLFLAFAIREGGVPTQVLGRELGDAAALGLVGASFALGTFASTAIGTRLRIRRPVRLQAIGFAVVATAGVFATLRFTLGAMVLFCCAIAVATGLAKLALDASIQERIPETVRASAFAHAETLLMLAWVGGGGLGLVPFNGEIGVAVAAASMMAATGWGIVGAWRTRAETLHGRARDGTRDSARADGQTTRGPTSAGPATATLAAVPTTGPTTTIPSLASPADTSVAPPGFHVFRPSSSGHGETTPGSDA